MVGVRGLGRGEDMRLDRSTRVSKVIFRISVCVFRVVVNYSDMLVYVLRRLFWWYV